MDYFNKELEIAGKKITVESGKLARQSNGSCIVKIGETIILATSVASVDQNFIADFMPLTVDYRERNYAAGKIPGGFFKRETRPRDGEILISRLIDRSIRPIFPKYWRNDTQISVLVLSHDGENDPDMISIFGSSIALYISDLPFNTPVASVKIGKINGCFVVNPLIAEQKFSELDLIVSGTENAITMVEASANEISEDEMTEALNIAENIIKKMCLFQAELSTRTKINNQQQHYNMPLRSDIESAAISKIELGIAIKEKYERELFFDSFKKDLFIKLTEKYQNESMSTMNFIFDDIFNNKVREFILKKKIRLDGRGIKDIRPITCEINILPRVHGSSLFTRGQTQALATVTLGTQNDMQIIDELAGEYKERFMFHYNFPGFATGEPKGQRSTSRREIGHGNLAKKALKPILPNENDFGYIIRIVSDILESNGSSSMASVCGGSLALFNAGVPVKSSCAGVAMGLIKSADDYVILTDIMGLEDHIGDMDFKVAGTRKGITALQMDIKVSGITIKIISDAIKRARQDRLFILDKMDSVIPAPSNSISSYAPRMITMSIPQDKIGDLIGPGGKNIRKIQEDNNVKIDIEENGKVFITGFDFTGVDSAKEYIESLTVEVKIGKVYNAKIVKIMTFGAFAEILPGKEGLIHISQLSEQRVKRVEDIVKEGDEVKVKVIEIDNHGRINLSIKLI